MLYNQPLATRFGTDLSLFLRSPDWRSLDIAVAWVRASALRHIGRDLESFVRAGRRLRIIAGIDLDNTTQEGLEALLALTPHGHVELFVYHNEAGGIFHPKLYLFTGDVRARLIVGSNNLTQAGLFENTEAGLSVDLAIADPTIRSAQEAIAAWSDVGSRLARPLDAALLVELVANGYVRTEAAVRRERATRAATSRKGKKHLFGSSPVTVPTYFAKPGVKKTAKRKPGKGGVVLRPGKGAVLLMRVRKSRGSQIQLPILLVKQFFSKPKLVRSAHTSDVRSVNKAKARGKLNTYKLEIPESRSMTDPVIRFAKGGAEIVYQVFDAASARGRTIMRSLRAGLTEVPQSTLLTRPASPDTSTWWRFI